VLASEPGVLCPTVAPEQMRCALGEHKPPVTRVDISLSSSLPDLQLLGARDLGLALSLHGLTGSVHSARRGALPEHRDEVIGGYYGVPSWVHSRPWLVSAPVYTSDETEGV
jgi:hypothetical protein